MDQDVIERFVNRAARPMVWGRDDCAIWAGDVLQALTGVDLMSGWRGLYHSEAEAAQAMSARGGGLVRHVMAAVRDAGWLRVDPSSAVQPALGLVCQGQGRDAAYACCVASAPGWFMSRALEGVTVIPSSLVRRAWQCRRP